MQWKEKEGGWMRVMEVNRKGWTAWCMDITRMGLRGAGWRMEGRRGGGGTPHRSTASQRTLTSWLATVRFYNQGLGGGWVVLKYPLRPQVHPRLVKSNTRGKSEYSSQHVITFYMNYSTLFCRESFKPQRARQQQGQTE